jgi:hypothetical protein
LCLGKKQPSAAEQHNVTKHESIIGATSFEACDAVSSPSAARRGHGAARARYARSTPEAHGRVHVNRARGRPGRSARRSGGGTRRATEVPTGWQ